MQKNKFRDTGNGIRVTPVCLAIIFIIIALAGCAKREIKNIDSRGKNIICFGDSLTFGYGVNPGEDYPAALRKMVLRQVINAGVDGDRSIEGLARIKADVLDKDPYIVLIEFTGNDFLKKVPLEETMNNIRKMIAQIQAQGAMTAIVDVSAGFFLRDYRLRLAKLADETGSIFVPAVLTGIITNPSMKSDFMHPNPIGYKIVAQRVCRAIAAYLTQQKN